MNVSISANYYAGIRCRQFDSVINSFQGPEIVYENIFHRSACNTLRRTRDFRLFITVIIIIIISSISPRREKRQSPRNCFIVIFVRRRQFQISIYSLDFQTVREYK